MTPYGAHNSFAHSGLIGQPFASHAGAMAGKHSRYSKVRCRLERRDNPTTELLLWLATTAVVFVTGWCNEARVECVGEVAHPSSCVPRVRVADGVWC